MQCHATTVEATNAVAGVIVIAVVVVVTPSARTVPAVAVTTFAVQNGAAGQFVPPKVTMQDAGVPVPTSIDPANGVEPAVTAGEVPHVPAVGRASNFRVLPAVEPPLLTVTTPSAGDLMLARVAQ